MTIQDLRAYQRAEFGNRKAAAIFLTLYALIGLDTMAIEDEQKRAQATATWIAWGTVFILLGFFIIAPEQEAVAARQEAESRHPTTPR